MLVLLQQKATGSMQKMTLENFILIESSLQERWGPFAFLELVALNVHSSSVSPSFSTLSLSPQLAEQSSNCVSLPGNYTIFPAIA
jgi:hypothetical protein